MKPLDPKARALLTAIAVAGEPDIASIAVEVARNEMNAGYARLKTPVIRVDSSENITIPGPEGEIPVRIFKPAGNGPFPVILFFHGGGWVFHLEEAYESICTHLCWAANAMVITVDYRLAPEHPFPAGLEDCYHASRWIMQNTGQLNGNPDQLFLAGDSAGGNFAAVTAIRLRDDGIRTVKGQVLIYPVTDHRDSIMPSYDEFADGMGLTREAMKWYWDHYLRDKSDILHPWAAPLLAENLAGLPPALIITAGYDPVRDEGNAYAQRLMEAGVNVQLSVYEEMIHGFLSYLGLLKQGHEAIAEVAAWTGKQISGIPERMD